MCGETLKCPSLEIIVQAQRVFCPQIISFAIFFGNSKPI